MSTETNKTQHKRALSADEVGELLGVQMDTVRPVFAWMDERRQRLQAMVDKALPGRADACAQRLRSVSISGAAAEMTRGETTASMRHMAT